MAGNSPKALCLIYIYIYIWKKKKKNRAKDSCTQIGICLLAAYKQNPSSSVLSIPYISIWWPHSPLSYILRKVLFIYLYLVFKLALDFISSKLRYESSFSFRNCNFNRINFFNNFKTNYNQSVNFCLII